MGELRVPAGTKERRQTVIRALTLAPGSLGGRDYTARIAGNEVTLRPTKGKPFVVSLDPAGRAGRTKRVDRWKVGHKTYAVHLIFYERIGDQARLGLALRVEK